MAAPPAIEFVSTYDAVPGEAMALSPLITRVLCPNPGPYTFTGTNSYVLGDQRVVVVDPGPSVASHLDALVAAIAGRPVVAIALSHTHADHSPAAAELARRTGAATYGFGPHPQPVLPPMEPVDPDKPETAEEGADRSFVPDHALAGGATIAVDGWHLDALHTPGHIANHLCFAVREEATLLSGDHVMGWSTSVISPRDGSLRDYLTSCDRLLTRPDDTYLSAHGDVLRSPHTYVEALVAHRRHRSEQVLGVLAGGPSTVGPIVERLYPGLDPRLVRAAKATITSHLVALRDEGVVSTETTPSFSSLWALV